MFNNGSQKLSRRQVALDNLKVQLQRWKDATSDLQVAALISSKDHAKVARAAATFDSIRKAKIANCEALIPALETSISRGPQF